MKFLHGLPSRMHSMGASLTTLQPTQTTTKSGSTSSSVRDTITLTPTTKSPSTTPSATPSTTPSTASTSTTPKATQSYPIQSVINSSGAKATTTTIRPTTSASAIQQASRNVQAQVSTTGSANSNVVPRQQYNDLNAEFNKLKAEHKNCGDLINRCRADNADKQKQIVELQKRLDILSSRQSEASKMEALLKECERIGQQNTSKIRDLEGKLQAKIDICNQLTQQINAVSQANSGNQANSNVQALLDTCNSQLALLQQQIVDLTNRNQALLDENSNLQAQSSNTTNNSNLQSRQFSLLSANDAEFGNDRVQQLYVVYQDSPNDADAIIDGLKDIDLAIEEISLSRDLNAEQLEAMIAKNQADMEKSSADITTLTKDVSNLTKERDTLSKQLEDVKKLQTTGSSESDSKQKQLEKDLESARLKGNIGLAACGVVLGYATYKYIKAPK